MKLIEKNWKTVPAATKKLAGGIFLVLLHQRQLVFVPPLGSLKSVTKLKKNKCRNKIAWKQQQQWKQ